MILKLQLRKNRLRDRLYFGSQNIRRLNADKIRYVVVPEKVHKTSVYRNDNEKLVSWDCRDFLENA